MALHMFLSDLFAEYQVSPSNVKLTVDNNRVSFSVRALGTCSLNDFESTCKKQQGRWSASLPTLPCTVSLTRPKRTLSPVGIDPLCLAPPNGANNANWNDAIKRGIADNFIQTSDSPHLVPKNLAPQAPPRYAISIQSRPSKVGSLQSSRSVCSSSQEYQYFPSSCIESLPRAMGAKKSQVKWNNYHTSQAKSIRSALGSMAPENRGARRSPNKNRSSTRGGQGSRQQLKSQGDLFLSTNRRIPESLLRDLPVDRNADLRREHMKELLIDAKVVIGS